MDIKKLFLLALVALHVPCVVLADDAPRPLAHPYSSLPAVEAGPNINKNWNRERLDYEIYWGLMNVGEAYLQIDKIVLIDGRQAYHIISGAKSAALISKFYTVSDMNESWMDVTGQYSDGYYKNIQEGGYRVNEWVVFDNSSATFRGEKMNKKGEVSQLSGSLPGQVNDVLSSLYLVRGMSLEPGTSRTITVNTKKNWDMNVKVRKREKESTALGKFKCVVVEPQLGDDGLFVAKEGKKMLVWITDDDLRLPLVLKAEIFIGSVTAKLVKRTVQ